MSLESITPDQLYKHFKNGGKKYDEEFHCKLLIQIMFDRTRGTMGAFCIAAMINERTFINWCTNHEVFGDLYSFCRIVAKELWEEEGRRLRDRDYPMGTVNYAFEHWKLIGWSRFGISRNSKLKLSLNPKDSPAKHYETILRQAAEGDFTAAEFKQLMEAVNVGINVHQLFELQKQIDELKSDLSVMATNKNVQNPFTNKGPAQKD